SSFPVADENGVIKACVGETVTFNGFATFGNSSSGATYTWDMDNGTLLSGQNVSYTFSEAGIYRVNLVVRDPSNCRNNNFINQIVQISTDAVIESDVLAEYCFGVDFTIEGANSFPQFDFQCTPPVSGVTFLPDGSGADYSTSIIVDCYGPNQLITSV